LLLACRRLLLMLLLLVVMMMLLGLWRCRSRLRRSGLLVLLLYELLGLSLRRWVLYLRYDLNYWRCLDIRLLHHLVLLLRLGLCLLLLLLLLHHFQMLLK
jgi:hypothetical protein